MGRLDYQPSGLGVPDWRYSLGGFIGVFGKTPSQRFLELGACGVNPCDNFITDWGFSVGRGLRRLSGAFVFVGTHGLRETPSSPNHLKNRLAGGAYLSKHQTHDLAAAA